MPKESGLKLLDYLDIIIVVGALMYIINKFGPIPSIIFSLVFPLIVALFVETRYVSRIGVLPNVLMLYVIMYPEWDSIDSIFKDYAVFGLILGVITLMMYNKDKSAGFLYRITYPFYSLKTIFPFYLSYQILESLTNQYFLPLSIVLLIGMWWLAVKRFNNDPPFR